MDQSLLYRSLLRVSLVITAFLLVFPSGLVDDRTATLFSLTTDNLGAMVGMSASVAPTEINQITAGLSQQQQLLNAREQTIAEREIELGLSESGGQNSSATTTYVLAAILFIQLILLVLNYVLDYLRSKERDEQSGIPA